MRRTMPAPDRRGLYETLDSRPEKRQGRIYLDTTRNARGQAVAVAYCAPRIPGPRCPRRSSGPKYGGASTPATSRSSPCRSGSTDSGTCGSQCCVRASTWRTALGVWRSSSVRRSPFFFRIGTCPGHGRILVGRFAAADLSQILVGIRDRASAKPSFARTQRGNFASCGIAAGAVGWVNTGGASGKKLP